jgi:hypothetical protein
MATPDRTEELVRAMLARRADGPAPGWLADRTMHAVTAARQERRGFADRIQLPDGTPARVALAAAITLLLVALAGSALAVGGYLDDILDPGPALPAVIVGPEGGSPSAGSLPPDGDASPEPADASPVAAPTPRPVPDTLAADTLAVVTKGGRNLRVRTAPGLGSDSKQLEPLLPAGARMFVVGGPVPADGYDWYEVQTDAWTSDIDLYGWVAAADKEGAPWIKPSAPSCPDARDSVAIAETAPLDRLACFGDAPYEVLARQVFLMDDEDEDEPCPWAPGNGACSIEPSWMGVSVELFIGEMDSAPGETGGVLTMSVVIPPEVQAAAPGLEYAEDLRVTLSADSPEARDCRYLDRSGDEVQPRARAVLDCRTRLVVRDLAWDTSRPPEAELSTDSMAIVVVDSLAIESEPWEETRVVEDRLGYGTRVYVDAQWPEAGPAEWYAILPEEPQNPRYGWVPATIDGTPTLEADDVDCVPMDDWPSFVELSRVERLACVGSDPVALDMWVWRMQAANPEWSDGCTAWTYMPQPYVGVTCDATPEWLATFSGVAARRPGDMEMFVAIEPSTLAASDLPDAPEWARVTGSWEWPTSDECRVRDAATGQELLRPAHAAIYCRATFVVTGIEPATTSP